MANIIEVTGAVVKLEADKNGFIKMNLKGEDGAWHNNIGLTHNGKGIKTMPTSFGKGDRISISYDKDNYSNAVTSPTVLPKESSQQGGGKPQGGFKKGGYNKGNDDGRQEMIVRQSGINYALQAVLNSAKKTDKPDDIIADAIKMAENTILPYVMKGKSGVPDIFGGESNPSKSTQAPAKQTSAKQEKQAEPEVGSGDFDDD